MVAKSCVNGAVRRSRDYLSLRCTPWFQEVVDNQWIGLKGFGLAHTNTALCLVPFLGYSFSQSDVRKQETQE
jgi:hypothetical protein